MFHSRLQRPVLREPIAAPGPTGPLSGPPAGAASPDAARPGEMSRLVREALERGRVRMEFQPVLMLGQPRAAAIHEGFVRILDGEGRTIPASRFMGAVEESALGRELDREALRLAINALAARPGLRVAVNASARSVGNAAWRETLEAGLRAAGPRLTLEVGEGSATGLADRLARFMAEMRPRGLSVVLDDFGTGPLALRQLRDFRFDGVKIDRAFVANIAVSADDQALVGALVSVAHRFGMYAVAKGVETDAQANRLRELGIDGLQGFLYGRPGPIPGPD